MNSGESTQAPGGSGWGEWVRSHRVLVSFVTHTILFTLAWFTSFTLAYNFQKYSSWFYTFAVPLLPLVLVIKTAVFYFYGLYRDWWRYVGLRDIFGITIASWVGVILVLGVFYVMQNVGWLGLRPPFEEDFPDSVFLFDLGITIALVGGARVAVRLFHEDTDSSAEGAARRLLVVGAGNAGENAVREMLRMSGQHCQIVGFLDDDPTKQGALIHGLEVLGTIADIREICEEEEVEEVLIAMPSASKAVIRRVVEMCGGTGLRFKTLPSLADVLDGRASVNQIRDVDINDLLGRAPVSLDEGDIAAFLKGRVVMVTGAGGSIGSEMCRQIARFSPRRLVLVEQAEQHLFDIDRELERTYASVARAPYIADISDRRRIEHIFESERPSAVFHAAAHKHVPMMEINPGEALKNNIHGTRVVADAASRFECEKFVMISTDKAVNPTSVMGCSKRVAELYIQGLNSHSRTQFVTVRFGNVLGSSGSVIPIFKEQIARGGPVTVTDPRMVRYFMTIPEASQLVLQAASMGRGGEIFVLDMGEPVRIVDLAREMITLSGFRPDEDIRIEISGIRPGEKLYEELATAGENVSSTKHPKIGIWQNIAVDWPVLVREMDDLLINADGFERAEIRNRLKAIVPEFQLEPPPERLPGRDSASTPNVAVEMAT